MRRAIFMSPATLWIPSVSAAAARANGVPTAVEPYRPPLEGEAVNRRPDLACQLANGQLMCIDISYVDATCKTALDKGSYTSAGEAAREAARGKQKKYAQQGPCVWSWTVGWMATA